MCIVSGKSHASSIYFLEWSVGFPWGFEGCLEVNGCRSTPKTEAAWDTLLLPWLVVGFVGTAGLEDWGRGGGPAAEVWGLGEAVEVGGRCGPLGLGGPDNWGLGGPLGLGAGPEVCWGLGGGPLGLGAGPDVWGLGVGPLGLGPDVWGLGVGPLGLGWPGGFAGTAGLAVWGRDVGRAGFLAGTGGFLAFGGGPLSEEGGEGGGGGVDAEDEDELDDDDDFDFDEALDDAFDDAFDDADELPEDALDATEATDDPSDALDAPEAEDLPDPFEAEDATDAFESPDAEDPPDALDAPEAEDPTEEPAEEALAVEELEEDSLESYLLTGLGWEGNSSQLTQPSLLLPWELLAVDCNCPFLALGLWFKAALAKLSQGWGLRPTEGLESCLGSLTFMVGTVGGFTDCVNSSKLPGFLGEALRGRSTLANLHSTILLLLGVIVTVRVLNKIVISNIYWKLVQ